MRLGRSEEDRLDLIENVTRPIPARYEVFDPRIGYPYWTFRWAWLAATVAKLSGLDWAKDGDGWNK